MTTYGLCCDPVRWHRVTLSEMPLVAGFGFCAAPLALGNASANANVVRLATPSPAAMRDRLLSFPRSGIGGRFCDSG
jgi:hypothetical protein